MYKTETHLHTSEVSACGHLSAREMVELYHQHQYHTIFVTDHFYDPAGDWQASVNRFFEGYRCAKAAADSFGMVVLPSAEIMLHCSPNHYLIYGDVADFLCRNEGLLDRTVAEFSALTQESGILLIQAHPFRDSCVPTPEYVNGLEVFNTSPRHLQDEDEAAAMKIAQENHLLFTCGSDAHRYEDVARGGIESAFPITGADDYRRALESRSHALIHPAQQ